MPWTTRKRAVLTLIGAAVVALSVVVFVLNQSASSDVLAVVGLLGGIAIVVNSLPDNGSNGHG